MKRLVYLIALCVCFGRLNSRAVISYDSPSAAEPPATAGATGLSWTHTVGSGHNRMLVVTLATEGTPEVQITGVSFGGVPLAPVPGGRAVNTSLNTNTATEIWTLANPPISTRPILVTFPGPLPSGSGVSAGAVSLFGVANAPAEAVATAATGSGPNFSLPITTVSNGSWLVDVANTSSPFILLQAATPGMFSLWLRAGGGVLSAGSSLRPVPSASTVVNAWTASDSGAKAHSIAAFAPAPPVTPGPPEVFLNSPASGSAVPPFFQLSATALDDTAVAEVRFYEDGQLLAVFSNPPYALDRLGAAVGPHALTAVAVDNQGNAATSTVVSVTVQADIAVGPSGSGVLALDTRAGADPFFTASIPGHVGQIVDTAGLDAAVSALAIFGITTPLGESLASGSSALAYWRSVDRRLGTQPTGNSATVLLAPLRNASSTVWDGLEVRYRLGLAGFTPSEYLKAYRVYWSRTGTPGSWTFAGPTPLPPPGDQVDAVHYLPLAGWAPGESVFLLWVDDNGTNQEGDYTLDDLSFTPFTGPAVTLLSPGPGVTLGLDFRVEALAGAAGAPLARVEFRDGPTPLGTLTSPPWSQEILGAAPGPHALSAVATDTLGRSATSAVVNVHVQAGSGELVRGPYLQQAGPDRITVRWRSSLGTRGQVRFGTETNALTQVVAETVTPAPPHDHVVTLTGLAPATRYFYEVGSASDTLAGGGADCTFVTAPPPGATSPVRIWAIGDAGTANGNQVAVRDAFETWTGTRTPDLVLQLGDNAYVSGTDAEYQAAMFNMYASLLRRTPFWSCLGNHETDQSLVHAPAYPYFDIYSLPTAGECGGVPSGTEHYYSFNHGNIHFIALDTMTANRSPSGPMAQWLRDDLASTTATWILCFFHHPPYTKGSHDSDVEGDLVQIRANLLPILEEGGVDLVLSGHSHSYERSYLLDGHYGLSGTFTAAMKKNAGDGRPDGSGAYVKPLTGPRDRFGAVYVVAGNAGQVTGGFLNHPAHFRSLNNLGSLVLDIQGPRLDATFLRENGTTPDTFTLIKQGAADGDQDLIADAYELLHGLDRRDPGDALLDLDGDGASNRLEYQFNTAAGTPDRYDFTVVTHPHDGTSTVTFPTETGRTYRVQASPDLLSWTPASPVFPGTGDRLSWVDTGIPASGPGAQRRFYRIELVMDP